MIRFRSLISTAVAVLFGTSLQAQECAREPIVLAGDEIAAVFGKDGADIDELPNAKLTRVEIYFEEPRSVLVSGRKRVVVPLGIAMQMTANDIVSKYNDSVSKNVPESTCPTRYSLGGVRLWPESLQSAQGRFNVTFKLHACIKTKSICSKWEDWTLKFWECWFEADTFLYQKTFEFQTHMTATVNDDGTSLSVVAPTVLSNAKVEEEVLKFLERVSNAIVNTSLGIGNAFAVSNLGISLKLNVIGDMKNRLPVVRLGPINLKDSVKDGLAPITGKIDEESAKLIIDDVVKNLALQKPGTGFGGKEGEFLFNVNVKTPDHRSRLPFEACVIRDALLTKLKYVQSVKSPETSYIIKDSDTAWSIAEKTYGDGLFYRVVLDENQLTESAAQAWHPGQEIKMKPFHQLVDEREKYVQAGDSLWQIAKENLGEGSKYKEILALNPQISDPNKIYPIDQLQLPSTP